MLKRREVFQMENVAKFVLSHEKSQINVGNAHDNLSPRTSHSNELV